MSAGTKTQAAFKQTISIYLLAVLSACATPDTKVSESRERQMTATSYLLEEIRVTPQTIVIDARPSFDYSLAHIPGSVSLQWSDFTEPEPSQRGILQGDLFTAARRLSRLGVAPSVPVVVVGKGMDGEGEEGRIAWMLAYMGVERVQFADIDAFDAKLVNTVEAQPPKAAPIWKPNPIHALNVRRQELQFVINNRGTEAAVRYSSRAPVVYKILDVRPAADYLGRTGFGAKNQVPNMDAVNIPWKEFFSDELRPKPALAEHLQSVGIRPEHRIIVLDEDGVSSAAVTMALQALGFANAGNYAGGLQDFLAAYGR